MNKLFTSLLLAAVASVTAPAYAQASAAQASAAQAPAATAPATAAPAAKAPATTGAKTVEAKVAMCMGCHNIKGYQASFPEVYKVPMIAGQSAKYIVSALTAYKNGDRKHPTMRGIATTLTDADMAQIAEWYSNLGKDQTAKLPAEAPAASDSQVAALLQKAACVSCHGKNLSSPIDPSYPKIAGQHKDYLFVALKAYKMDNNPNVGRSNPVMGAIAKQFSNAELKALAGYVASLDGEVKTVPESRFHQH